MTETKVKKYLILLIEWKFNSIKILKNDNILITEPVTNDMILIDTNFREIQRWEGIKGDSFSKIFLIKFKFRQ